MVHNIFTISFSFFIGTVTHGTGQIFLKYKKYLNIANNFLIKRIKLYEG